MNNQDSNSVVRHTLRPRAQGRVAHHLQSTVRSNFMKTIIKKIDKEWLDLILADKKKFELRIADFQIEEGDVLKLMEYTNDNIRKPTGRSVEKTVKYLRKVDLKKWIEKQPKLLEKGFYVIQFD